MSGEGGERLQGLEAPGEAQLDGPHEAVQTLNIPPRQR